MNRQNEKSTFSKKAVNLFSAAMEENKTCLVILHDEDTGIEVFLNGKNTPVSYGLFVAAKQSDKFREIIEEVARRLSVRKLDSLIEQNKIPVLEK